MAEQTCGRDEAFKLGLARSFFLIYIYIFERCLYLLLFSQAPLTFDSHYIYSWQVVTLTALWEVSHLQLWAVAQRTAGLPKCLHHWLSGPGS